MKIQKSNLTLLSVAALLSIAATAPALEFEVKPLTHGNATGSEAYGLNEQGEIVGAMVLPGSSRRYPVLWKNGLAFLLPAPQDSQFNRATAINNDGKIIGTTQKVINSVTYSRGAVWEAGSPLMPIQAFLSQSAANIVPLAINDSDQVVGWGTHAISGTLILDNPQGFRWTIGWPNPVNIGFLVTNDTAESSLVSVNSFGTAAGYSTDANGNRRVIRHKNNIQDLGIPAGYTTAQASGINASTAMSVNARLVGQPWRAVRWDLFDGYQTLPTLAGKNSYSHLSVGINDQGTIIGHATGNAEFIPLLWSDGAVHPINTLLTNSNGWTVSEVNDINERGQMVGFGKPNPSAPGQAILISPVQSLTYAVGLSDYVGGAHGVPYTVEFRDPNTNQVLDTRQGTLSGGGSVGVATIKTTAQGTVKVRFKAWHWLSRVFTITLPAHGSASSSTIVFNGDVDGDDEVTIFDYIDLSAAFDTSSGEANFSADADLDGDGSVTIFDYIILSNNFDKAGDL